MQYDSSRYQPFSNTILIVPRCSIDFLLNKEEQQTSPTLPTEILYQTFLYENLPDHMLRKLLFGIQESSGK